MLILLILLMLTSSSLYAQDFTDVLPEEGYNFIYHYDLELMREIRIKRSPAIVRYLKRIGYSREIRKYEPIVDQIKNAAVSITYAGKIETTGMEIVSSGKSKEVKLKRKTSLARYATMYREEGQVRICDTTEQVDNIVIIKFQNVCISSEKAFGKEVMAALKTGDVFDYSANGKEFFLFLADHEILVISEKKEMLTDFLKVKKGYLPPFRGSEVHKLILDNISKNSFRWFFHDNENRRQKSLEYAIDTEKSEALINNLKESIGNFPSHSLSFSYFDETFNSREIKIFRSDEAAENQFYGDKHNPARKQKIILDPKGNRIAPKAVNKKNGKVLKGDKIIKYRSVSVEDIEEEFELLNAIKKDSESRAGKVLK